LKSGFSYPGGGPQADLTIEAKGLTLEEAFRNVALGAFNAMTPLEGVENREVRKIEVESEDLQALLYDFLDDLLFLHDSELLVFSDIDVRIRENPPRLVAECRGERFSPERHRPGVVVKAVTFHQMKIDKGPDGWIIRVVFDI